jgi:glycosyltransferase involved in cell wall biosynthesis
MVLLAPRGEFTRGALEQKRIKKRVANALWKRVVAGTPALTWHATSELEVVQIHRMFPEAKHILVSEPLAEDARVELDEGPPGPLRAVFIGRISPMKNLTAALEALQLVLFPVDFEVHGPLEDAKYWATCKALAADLPPHVSFSYRGELLPGDVVTTFARHDVFLFPTLGESFGHVIAESLAGGCPVICSDQTPWSTLLESGGGWAISRPTARDLAGIVDGLAAGSAPQRLARRQRARAVYVNWLATRSVENVIASALVRTDRVE